MFDRAVKAKDPFIHQTRSYNQIRSAFAAGHKRVCCQLPTGAGKTFLSSMIIHSALHKGKRVMFTAPKLSLIDQTVEAFEDEGLYDLGVIQGCHPRTDYGAPLQICSVQTMARRILPETDMVIVDEAHIKAKAIQEMMTKHPDLPFLGLSATPWRPGMADEYSHLVIGATIGELIGQGRLSDYRVFAPSHPDLSSVGTVGGDYNQKQLAAAVDPMVADVVETWLLRGEDRPTLVFAVDRAHAKNLQRKFIAAGVQTEYVDAYTPTVERMQIQRRLEAGQTKVVVNVGCLTTGVDWDVRCISIARPTKSPMLHVQMIGRGLRTAHGKTDCIVLDHSDNTLRLGMVEDIHFPHLLKAGRQRSSVERSGPTQRPCPACSFLKPPKTRECPACGHISNPPNGEVEMKEGELIELDSRRKKRKPEPNRQAWYSQLLAIATKRGRTNGWAAHTYKDKFGDWPRGLTTVELEPTVEVLNFVKAKDIRWAKRRKT